MESIKPKLWDSNIHSITNFMVPLESEIIVNYFNEQKRQATNLLKAINMHNFDQSLASLIGIDRKLQLLLSFLNPRDFRIVDNDAQKLLELIEKDYKIYHYEQLSTDIYPLIKNSITYPIR